MGSRQTRRVRSGPLDIEILRSTILLSAHQTRHHVGGADPLPVGVPVNVGVANAEGVAADFARRDHVHKGCRIATGSYTGDGSTSHAITGVGFTPKLVWIAIHYTAEAMDPSYVRFEGMAPNICLNFDIGGVNHYRDNELISLDADGFTVDDDGADRNPNKAGQVYDYCALG